MIRITYDNSPFYALSATCRQRKTELLELKISNDWKNCTLPLQGVIIVVDEQNTAKKKNPHLCSETRVALICPDRGAEPETTAGAHDDQS